MMGLNNKELLSQFINSSHLHKNHRYTIRAGKLGISLLQLNSSSASPLSSSVLWVTMLSKTTCSNLGLRKESTAVSVITTDPGATPGMRE